MYNPINCAGWETTAGSWIASSDCFKAKIGFVILFFVIAIIRKWGGEEIGVNFSFLLSLIFGLLSYFLIIIFTGSFKVALGIGLLLALVGGYGGGVMGFGGEGE